MFKTQKMFEENITIINESSPARASGGIAVITEGSSTTIKAVVMPDLDSYAEPRKEGQYNYERLFAQVRKSEMDRVNLVKGKTKLIWNGLEYKIVNIIDYTSKKLFQNAEIEARRKIDVD